MRSLLLSVCLLSFLCSPAFAGRNANGAMLLHVDNSVIYSPSEDYCSVDPLPITCDGLVTSITRDPSLDSVVWMVARFCPNSSPGVNGYQVGLGGNITLDYFDAWAPCGPGFLEIPDAGWPGTGTGTAVAYTSTVYSTMFKIYWFAVTSPGTGSTLGTTNYYAGDHHAEWVDDGNPPVIDFCNLFGAVQWGGPGFLQCADCGPLTGACCFPDCSCLVLTQMDCAALGGSYYGDGTTCAPNPCECPTGACCFQDGTCIVDTQFECESIGGVFQGIGTACAPDPCQIIGACCFCDGCREMTQFDCGDQWGEFMGGGVPCTPNPCPSFPTGACCDGERCVITTQRCCDWIWMGDDTVCDPNPCLPTPTRVTTWGKIKAAYR